jgi:hypothetical protein
MLGYLFTTTAGRLLDQRNVLMCCTEQRGGADSTLSAPFILQYATKRGRRTT